MWPSIGVQSMLLASLTLTTLGANGGGDSKPFPSTLANALVRDPDVAPCAQAAHARSSAAYAGQNFDLSNVKLTSGPNMVVVTGGGSCVCGNANCKIVVFQQQGDAYRSVLSDYGIDWKVRPDGSAVVTSHDSAAVVYRTSYRWTGKTYAVTATDMVYLPSNVSKPATRVIAFAPGATTAVIRGNKLALGFEDDWTFSARAGQTIAVTVVKRDSHFGSLSIRSDGTTLGSTSSGTLRFVLPQSRKYNLTVEGSDESLASYALSVRIH